MGLGIVAGRGCSLTESPRPDPMSRYQRVIIKFTGKNQGKIRGKGELEP